MNRLHIAAMLAGGALPLFGVFFLVCRLAVRAGLNATRRTGRTELWCNLCLVAGTR